MKQTTSSTALKTKGIVDSAPLKQLLLSALLGGFSLFVNAADDIDLDWQSPLFKDHPLVGTLHSEKPINSLEQLIEQMARVRFTLIGEKHDNPDHQQLEQYLLEALRERISESNDSMAVVMEMLDSSQQEQVDAVEKVLVDDNDLQLSLEQIKAELEWPEQGWSWDDYAPVISWVLNNRVPLLAGNIDNAQMMSVYREGIDSRFASAEALREDLQENVLEQVYQGHCELMEKEALSSMVDIQLVKDAAMAHALVEADADNSVLLAGTGHIRNDSAIPKHLQIISGDPMLSIALVEVDPARISVNDYDVTDRFDVVIFTPVANQHDYCADLRKSMEKR